MAHHDEKPPVYTPAPVSALSPNSRDAVYDHDANAPEVVELVSPSVASPAYGFQYGQQRFQDGTTLHSNSDHGGEDATDKEVVPAEYGTHQNLESAFVEPARTSPSISSHQPPYSPKTPDAPLPPLPKEERKILGLKRRPFFILLALLIAVVVAAVVGGVAGGVISSKSKSPPADSAAETNITTTPLPTPTTPTSTTSSTSSSATPTATFLSNQTSFDEGWAFQGFSRNNFSGAYTKIIRDTEGGTDFDYDIHSYDWVAKVTNCCVSFCNNATKAGWVGYTCASRHREAADESFARVFLWCSNNQTTANARGKCV